MNDGDELLRPLLHLRPPRRIPLVKWNVAIGMWIHHSSAGKDSRQSLNPVGKRQERLEEKFSARVITSALCVEVRVHFLVVVD